LTENDRELAKGAAVLGVVALLVIVLFYLMTVGPMPGAR
jgi:hypothetical protein